VELDYVVEAVAAVDIVVNCVVLPGVKGVNHLN
jgi:hypothetical protein